VQIYDFLRPRYFRGAALEPGMTLEELMEAERKARLFSDVVPLDTAGISLWFAHPSDHGTVGRTPRLLSYNLRDLLDNSARRP
jgi:hypothetical protein